MSAFRLLIACGARLSVPTLLLCLSACGGGDGSSTDPVGTPGYTLTATQLAVQRPLWNTVFPLAQLSSVAGDAEVFRGALRLFGNGGIFSFTGFFWKRGIGCYRAFATDPGRAVILKFKKRTIVVTPHDPQHFIVRVRTHLAAAAPATVEDA